MNDTNSWEQYITGNEQQLEAIKSKHKLTVVSAGAGTGKTQTLAHRFAYILASDSECHANEILVLTFTEKAAQEMRERIKRVLENLYKKNADELPWLKERISELDDADISTIHSFAMKITREAGLAVDIDPAFAITPDASLLIFKKNFAAALSMNSLNSLQMMIGDDAVWKNRAEELFEKDCFMDFVNEYTPDTLADMTMSVISKYSALSMTPEELWQKNYPKEIRDAQNAIRQSVDDEIWDTWTSGGDDSLIKTVCGFAKPSGFIAKLQEVCENWAHAEDTEENKKGFVTELFENGLANLRGGSNDSKDILKEALGTGIKEWRDSCKEIIAQTKEQSEKEIQVNETFKAIAAIGWQCWELKKRIENSLSMDDLIKNAKQVLEQDTGYKTRYKHIMVDEFQDTDPQQDLLIKALWNNDGDDAEKVNTLFVVGDLKQSIYRFRNADLKLFGKYIEMAKSGNKPHADSKFISLTENYRSDKKLIALFNNVFGKIWENGVGDGGIAYENIVAPQKEYPDKGEILTVVRAQYGTTGQASSGDRSDEENAKPFAEEKRKKEQARRELYDEVANTINEMHNCAEIGSDSRKAQWRDFTILVPTRTSYRAIERAFEDANIPYVLCTSKNYFGRDEVTSLISLINVLAFPNDAMSLALWFVSPFSEVKPELTERMLFESMASKRTLAETAKKVCPEAMKKLSELRKIAMFCGVSDVLLEIRRSSKYLRNYKPNQRRRVISNIKFLADLADEYESTQEKSLAGCAIYLQSAIGSKLDTAEPEVTDDTQDSVKVMTIHASKGLQFPITIIGEADYIQGSKSSSYRMSDKFGISANKLPKYLMTDDIPDNKQFDFAVSLLIKSEEKTATEYESQRLWYVAATRAESKLIVTGLAKKDNDGNWQEKGFFNDIKSYCINEDGTVGYPDSKIRNAATADADVQTGNENENREDEPKLGEKLELITVNPPALGRISASAYAMLAWCPAAYRISYRQGRGLKWETAGDKREGGGSDFGTLAHAVLRKWDFTQESLDRTFAEENIRETIKALPAEVRFLFEDKKTRKSLQKMLQQFINSEQGKKLAEICKQNGSFERETPFRVNHDRLLMVGATDLYYEDENGTHILDWKTTDETAAPGDFYKAQLDFYACAKYLFDAEFTKSFAPIDAALVYLRDTDKKEEPRKYDEHRLKEIASDIHKKAEIALSGAFEPNRANCARCPWKNSCGKKGTEQ